MTLLVTEIHVGSTIKDSIVFFGADRRISLLPQGGKKNVFFRLSKKIFTIPYLNAGIGFFGLAEVRQLKGKQIISAQRMSDWLSRFVTKSYHLGSLCDFANALTSELTRVIPSQDKRKYPSGFHLAGFNAQGFPEFWFVRNIEGMDDYAYQGFNDQYVVTEEFLTKQARDGGFDGVNEAVQATFRAIYRNGDYRGHVASWNKADEIMRFLSRFPDFKSIRSIEQYEDYIKFKIRLIASIYKKYCSQSIIGTPVDTLHIAAPNRKLTIKQYPL